MNASEVQTRTLELSVRNETGMFSSSQKLLGMVLVDLTRLDPARAVTQWYVAVMIITFTIFM